MKTNILIFTVIVLINACAPSKTISTQKANTYEESVSVLRIDYADSLQASNPSGPASVEHPLVSGLMTTQYAITTDINEYLDERSELNREKNSYQGYTLQVYTGGSRDEANAAKRRVYDALPEARPTISYNSSIYRVRVGEYANRLAAQADYAMLQEEFPYVLLVPQLFELN